MYMYMYIDTCTGDVAFGKHGEGQLRRSAEGEGGGTGKGQEAEAWHLSPSLIPRWYGLEPAAIRHLNESCI